MLIRPYKFHKAFIKWNFLDMEQIEQGSRKYGHWNLKKITVCPNEAINEDCAVAFSGGYEKLVSM